MLEALQYQFVQNALLAGVLASVACGIVGTFVVVKRIALISGGISHASLGGIGMAIYLGLPPTLGAAVFGLGSAILIAVVTSYTREHEDTLIGALWAMGMAVGLLFIHLTPGYAGSLENFLFGNLLLVSKWDLILSFGLNVLIVTVVAVLYKELLAVSLDEEFAYLRGVPTGLLYALLLSLVALTVVVLIQVVGIILVIALLTLPPAISRWFTRRMKTMMALSCILGAVFSVSGIFISYYSDLPTGPCIILLAAGVYTVGLATRRWVYVRRSEGPAVGDAR